MRAAPAFSGAAQLGVARLLRRFPAPSRLHGTVPNVSPPLRLAAQADGAMRAAEPAAAATPKRAVRMRKPRDLPALENALQAAADAETVLPPTRTEEQLFADVKAHFAELGKSELLDCYVRILGRRVAFLAVLGNQMMQFNENSVEDIEQIVAEITRLTGFEAASRILYREPSVLYGTPAAVADSIAALEETLGTAAGAFALGRNPALLQSGRAAHIRVALQTLQDLLGGDGAVAAEMVQKNTLLLGTNGDTLRGSFDALCSMFGGPEAAKELIRMNPGLLRTRVSTLYESIEALAEIFGSMDAAADAVNMNRSLLKARPKTLLGAFDALVEVYGSKEAARAVARMQLGVLRSLPKTIRAANAALRETCGEEVARSMIEMTPGLLQIRPMALKYNLAHFKAFLGKQRAERMADSMPHLIKMRVGRAAEVTAALVEIYGSKEDAAANCYPPSFRLTGEFLRERWKNLKTVFGGSETVARDIVLADPQLLTCLNWEATLTRLDRTGVAKRVPPDSSLEPGPPQEAVKRASINVLKKRESARGSVKRVSEPRRAAKTVQGAAAVAAAVARAERITERSPSAPKKQQQQK